MFNIQYLFKPLFYLWALSSYLIFIYTIILFIHNNISEDHWNSVSEEKVINNLYMFLVNFYDKKNDFHHKTTLENKKEIVFKHINMLNHEDYKTFYIHLLNNGLRKRVDYIRQHI